MNRKRQKNVKDMARPESKARKRRGRARGRRKGGYGEARIKSQKTMGRSWGKDANGGQNHKAESDGEELR